MRRAMSSAEHRQQMEEEMEGEDDDESAMPPDVDNLLVNCGIVLANASYYAPARPVLHKLGGVEMASFALGRSDDQLEIGLALLQNLSLLTAAQIDIMRCRFMQLVPRYLNGCKPLSIRLKALSIVQHLTSNPEHACLLIRHNLVILLTQELASRDPEVGTPSRARALSSLVNLTAIDPNAEHFHQPGLLRVLSALREDDMLAELVDHVLHNISNAPEKVTLSPTPTPTPTPTLTRSSPTRRRSCDRRRPDATTSLARPSSPATPSAIHAVVAQLLTPSPPSTSLRQAHILKKAELLPRNFKEHRGMAATGGTQAASTSHARATPTAGGSGASHKARSKGQMASSHGAATQQQQPQHMAQHEAMHPEQMQQQQQHYQQQHYHHHQHQQQQQQLYHHQQQQQQQQQHGYQQQQAYAGMEQQQAYDGRHPFERAASHPCPFAVALTLPSPGAWPRSQLGLLHDAGDVMGRRLVGERGAA